MPLLEQKLPIKEEKPSSEAHMNDKVGLVDESTVNPVQQKMDEFISQNRNADFYFVGSWPQHKRKKIECQLTNAFFASPTLKIGDAVQSDVGKNPLKDMHRNVEHQRIEEYKVSSSKQQVEEIEISLEGRGRSASTACNLMLEQGTPSVPSLKKLAGEHETGQHTAEEKNLYQFEDELEGRGTEVMPYTEDTILEKKDHLDRKDLSYGSSGSHSQIQSVICSDRKMPEYDGFVMETDDEQLCTSKEGIDFDKLDLPPNGLGRASVLDQLCKSTCLHSSFFDLPATYKLQEALNLCHSLPNGLFENIEQLDSSFRCLNQEVNQALHESHSVSPPLSDSQSAWDLRKLCASPVGKLWGGMPPKSSSSGKRVSSIPELPCISEENEITDGVIGTFLEGVGPEMFISSVTREPLADITENSNPLVSVCEAELNDDRNSIASLHTEFSFSGTCDGQNEVGKQEQK
ncbi:uncharacterized protein LOC110601181 isoform X1 [Manihot esculenta]|uniref:uncharacterized protein LOC110601181 isoform X1 n=1 Tax=Manihot esculenta TaxID=3983 RepID=UPI000B5D0AAC|nr:uncharacterized protein LOC110601181 isoform X1 [Manihot esculenta]XP_043807416.1 uncharacterized protein LOC110601181 isoform X1 [Manihot esculenta]